MSRERFEEFWRSQLSYRNSDKPATLKGWDARQSELDALNARIAELEAQVRTAGAEALEKMAGELRLAAKGNLSVPNFAEGLRAAADRLDEEARRLRGEGE